MKTKANLPASLPLALLASFAGFATAPQANGATLAFSSSTLISSSGTFHISVTDGKASYGGLASGTFGDGTVEAYALFTNANGGIGAGTVTPLNRYADKNGTLISTPTLTNTSTTGDTFGNANVFTTNDPGVGFAGTPNFATGVPTSSGGRVSNGTIDISGFSSGTIYLLAGAFGNDLPVNLSMTGTSQTTLTADNGVLTTAGNRNMYVFAYDFDNTGGLYDEISYSILNTGTNQANRARFMGAIVNASAIPEPSAALLGGLGLLALLRRRR
jgi:uncharacterized protein (TIGR03382 family)